MSVVCRASQKKRHCMPSSHPWFAWLCLQLLFVQQSTSADLTPVRPCLHMLLIKSNVHRRAAFGLSPPLRHTDRIYVFGAVIRQSLTRCGSASSSRISSPDNSKTTCRSIMSTSTTTSDPEDGCGGTRRRVRGVRPPEKRCAMASAQTLSCELPAQI